MERFIQEFSSEATDVTICGSMSAKESWLAIADDLKKHNLRVALPDVSEKGDWSQLSTQEIAAKKGWYIRRHIANIANTKAVLIVNSPKNGIDNYVGANSFLEMGIAFAYNKPIYLFYDAPASQSNYEEILALEPIVLRGSLDRLKEEVTT